jgi:hypothetical protein
VSLTLQPYVRPLGGGNVPFECWLHHSNGIDMPPQVSERIMALTPPRPFGTLAASPLAQPLCRGSLDHRRAQQEITARLAPHPRAPSRRGWLILVADQELM